jgi:hypothetical protein
VVTDVHLPGREDEPAPTPPPPSAPAATL